MRIPLYLALAQWALLLALGMLVVTAFRQLGRVTGRASTPAGLGPAAGSRPGRIAYQPISLAARVPAQVAEPAGIALEGIRAVTDGAVRVFVPGGGRPALLAFVDPTCPSCEQLVTVLTAMRDSGELAEPRILLLTSDPPGYLQISAAFQATSLEIGRPLDRADLEPYRPTATPLLVAINADGVVTKAAAVVQAAEIRAFSQSFLLPAPPPEVLLPVTT
ncbi:MAG: hypothetical protein ACRDNZ_15440 [Streptosporangiaceae bacterium]